jgi:tetratricopeptide (TPR) repeat protein
MVVQDKTSRPYRMAAAPLLALREAVALHDQGRFREAEQRYLVVLAANDRSFDALHRLGLIRLQQGRFGDAAKLFRRALKVERASADAHHHLGVALSGLRRHEEAIERYSHALSLCPNVAEAHNNLAYSLQALGRMEQAMIHYETALSIRPDYPEARNNLGIVCQALGRSAEAMAHYEKALGARPNYADAHKNLGNLLGAAQRYDEAASHYRAALAARPGDAECYLALGNIQRGLDRPEDSLAYYERALAHDPASVPALNGLGIALHMLGRSEQAIHHHERALAIKCTDAEAYSGLGSANQALGRLTEARIAFERAVEFAPGKAGGYWNLANSRRFSRDDPYLARMERAKKQLSLNVEEEIDLLFALGKAFADVGDLERSFESLLAGNSLKRTQIAYDEPTALSRLDRIRTTFTSEFLHERHGLGDSSDAPVFIVGMPRSGTTLVEQILASHPMIFGAGELRVIASLAERVIGANGLSFPEAVSEMSGEDLRWIASEYLRAVRLFAPAAERITDKMPGNFMLAGFIHLALPNARIIHVRRDARDTALSCFSILFARGHEFTYDLPELGRYFAAYHRLMDHWRDVIPGVMLEVCYEELVADIDSQARRLIAHCGLEWDETCLEFYRTERSVRTASANQVRLPIYGSSVGRWRHYERQMQPFLQALR